MRNIGYLLFILTLAPAWAGERASVTKKDVWRPTVNERGALDFVPDQETSVGKTQFQAEEFNKTTPSAKQIQKPTAPLQVEVSTKMVLDLKPYITYQATSTWMVFGFSSATGMSQIPIPMPEIRLPPMMTPFQTYTDPGNATVLDENCNILGTCRVDLPEYIEPLFRAGHTIHKVGERWQHNEKCCPKCGKKCSS